MQTPTHRGYEAYENGMEAERLALRYLRQKGHRYLAHRYRTRYGEIDLITEKGGSIIFTEVKYRKTLSQGEPFEAVSREKIRKLWLCARQYLGDKGTIDVPVRFDLVEITGKIGRYEGKDAVRIRHLEDIIEDRI